MDRQPQKGKGEMKRKLRIILVTTLLLLMTLPVLAQSGGGYDLSWNTVDSGGGTFSAGEDYRLGGTLGQPDAGAMAGGEFILSGGFWLGSSVESTSFELFLPLIKK